MKKLLLILSVFYTQMVISQNLVPNPSFEIYDTCPTYAAIYSQLSYAVPWFSPTFGSPDYFNACDILNNVGVPINWIGYQKARTGVAYAGFFEFAGDWASPNCREYITVKLTDSLQAGKKYCVQFYLSLADTSTYASDDIGVYFSKDSITSDSALVLPYNPQISNIEENYIIDKTNWVLISGEFIAQGGEQFMTIGNFKDDANTDTIFANGDTTNWLKMVYYYTDDISVTLCDSGDGIDEINKSDFFNIYPSGSKGVFYIDFKNIPVKFIYVYNIIGQVVFFDAKIKKNYFSLDLKEHVSGIYMISVVFMDKIITKKIFLSQ